ncbi:MAG: DNA internalization-related competence protein ComEC/Rec2 [Clostridia bacterium]|nr:DNA internalization-related competence protein ComEC/Rec2 [Clostridia bacterium]
MDPLDRLYRRRPLALAAAMILLGASVAAHSDAPVWIYGLLAAIAALACAMRPMGPLAVVCALMTGALVFAQTAALPAMPAQTGAVLAGDVLLNERSSGGLETLTLGELRVNGRAVRGKALLYLYEDSGAQIGQRIETEANLWQSTGFRSPGAFDTAVYRRGRGIVFCASSGEVQRIEKAKGSASLLQARMRQAMTEAIEKRFGEDAPLVRAMLLGDKSALSAEEKDAFRQAGVMYLLAVSGLHLNCLAAMIEWLLRRMGAGRRGAYLCVLPVMLAYVAAIGFPPSALRALTMYALLGGARMSGRPYDPLTALAAAFLILFARDPMTILDTGFVLSFSAVAGLLLLTPPIARALRLKRGSKRLRRAADTFTGALAASVGAILGTLPMTANAFGTVILASPLTALLAIPLTVAALPMALLSLLLPPVALPAAWILAALRRWTELMAGIPFLSVRTAAWPALLCLLYAGLVFLASDYWTNRFRVFRAACVLLLCLALPAANALAWLRLPDALTLTVLDAGEADAMAVTARKRTWLVDTGDSWTPADGFLRATGSRVEGVFLTHPHSDHAAGLSRVLEVCEVPVVYIPSGWDGVEHDESVDAAMEKARSAGVRVAELAAGDTVPLTEDAYARVLWPPSGEDLQDANSISMVLEILQGSASALLTGDLPASRENFAVPGTTVMKAAHHGSGSSNSAYLLRAAHPAALVISVGHNSYGHPSVRVIEEAAKIGARIARTDRDGTIVCTLFPDGSMEMETWNR